MLNLCTVLPSPRYPYVQSSNVASTSNVFKLPFKYIEINNHKFNHFCISSMFLAYKYAYLKLKSNLN